MSGMFSAVLLTITGISCVYLVFKYANYNHWLHTIGLSLIGIWSLARLPVKLVVGYTEPIHLMLHLGLTCLMLGLIIGRGRIIAWHT